MVATRLHIFDETLRDGEQQAGLFFAPELKRELAARIARCGVPQIDLMPAVDAEEEALAREIAQSALADRLTCATPLSTAHIDQALACGARRIILFYAVSDRLIALRDSDNPSASATYRRDHVLDLVEAAVTYATARGLRVDFAAEDASRADGDFLITCIRRLAPRLERFYLCDTVGILEPGTVAPWVRGLLDATGAHLGVHFHNDQGFAVANTVEGVRAGAEAVSGTFAGIGERAGNAALDQVLNCLRLRHDIVVDGIDYDAIADVLELLSANGIRPAAPYSAAAQRHVSGMHVQALMHDPQSYSIFAQPEPEIWFGKLGGASNVQYLYERVLGRTLPKPEYARISQWIKRQARREQRCFSPAEVRAWADAGAFDVPVATEWRRTANGRQ